MVYQRLTTPTPTAPLSPAAPRSVSRGLVIVALVIAIVVAAFTGFRVPSAWTATLDAVSLFDGFHTRFVVGTLLRPLSMACGYDYWLFAGFGFLVLAAVLTVLVRATLRDPQLSRRLLIVAWLLLPTGGFLFHEVGYLDQLLYLMLFGALWLLARGRVIAASAVLCVAPFVHESAAVVVLPIFGLVALRTLDARRAIAVIAPAFLMSGLVFMIPPTGSAAVAQLSATLAHASFPFREDALSVFATTLAERAQSYNMTYVFVTVRPVAILLVAAFCALWLTERALWQRSPGRMPVQLIVLCSCVAIAAPMLLLLAGFDANRWVFFVISNFFLVVWISLGDRSDRELGAASIVVIVTTLLVLSHFQFEYFDKYAPRNLGSRVDRKLLLRELASGSLFAIPRR